MNPQILVVGLGAALIVLGIVGGGMTVKGVAVPKMQNLGRVAAVILGLGLIGAGAVMFPSEGDGDLAALAQAPSAIAGNGPSMAATPASPKPADQPTPVGNSKIVSVVATYGKNGGAPDGNVSDYVAAKCVGHVECDWLVAVEGLADPAPNVAKDFIAKWRCEAGGVEKVTMLPGEASGKLAHLACP